MDDQNAFAMLDEARAHVEAAHRALVAAAGMRTEADWLRVLPGRSAVVGWVPPGRGAGGSPAAGALDETVSPGRPRGHQPCYRNVTGPKPTAALGLH